MAKIVIVSGSAELRRQIAEADGFIGSPTPDRMRAGKKLKWVQVGSAGVNNVRFLELIQSNGFPDVRFHLLPHTIYFPHNEAFLAWAGEDGSFLRARPLGPLLGICMIS